MAQHDKLKQRHGIYPPKPNTVASAAAALLARLTILSSSSREHTPSPSPSPAPSSGQRTPSPAPPRRDSPVEPPEYIHYPPRSVIPPDLRRAPELFRRVLRRRHRYDDDDIDDEPPPTLTERVRIAHEIIPILTRHTTKPSYAWHLREDNVWLLRRDNIDDTWCAKIQIGVDAYVYITYIPLLTPAGITHLVRNVEDAETTGEIITTNIATVTAEFIDGLRNLYTRAYMRT